MLKTGLAMIQGINGRDGDGSGLGTDYLARRVMFSKDKFRLDLIGLWLGGHEPGSVHMYRLRGSVGFRIRSTRGGVRCTSGSRGRTFHGR